MREYFELDPNLIYLNSGTHSFTPKCVMHAITRHQMEYEINPTLGIYSSWEKLWNVQKKLAAFLGARSTDIFLRPNITAVMNAFILGLPTSALPAHSEILTTDAEYGAITNIARFRCEQDKLTLRTLSLTHLDATEWADQVLRELRPETRVLLISHVFTCNGMILPLTRIAKETRRRGIFLIVDGAHAPGAMPLDFETLQDVDFYGGNLHKWMMGPKGTSFGWVPQRHHELLQPIQAGWTTFEYPAPFKSFGDGDLFQGRMLMSACHDFSPFFAIGDTLDFWERLGLHAIWNRLAQLRGETTKVFQKELGWPCLSPKSGELQGPLLSFELPPLLEAMGYGLMKKLLVDHQLQIGMPAWNNKFRLRISPHIYNTQDEILRCAKILKKVSQSVL